MLTYRMTSRVLYSAQHHRQHRTPQAFEQFGALYMHNLDDSPSAIQTHDSEFRFLTGQNEPPGPVSADGSPVYNFCVLSIHFNKI